MKKSTSLTLNATNLRLILTIIIFLIIGISVTGFYFASNKLKQYATDVSQITSEAEASASNIERLKQTELELQRYEQTIQRAANIVAESTSYQYQDQIINDLTSYAQRAGITIAGFTFDETNTTAAPAAAPTAPTPAATDTGTTTAPSAGVKSITATVQLEPTVPYVNLLRFMRLVEQNLTKMQLAKISLSQASGEDPQAVAGQALVIEVYVN